MEKPLSVSVPASDSAADALAKTSLWRSGLHTLVTSLILVGIGIVSSVIVARILGPAGKGGCDLVLATAALLSIVLGLSLPSGVTYVVAQGKANLSSLSLWLGLVALLEALVASALLWIIWSAGYATALLPPEMGSQAVAAVVLLLAFISLTGSWRAILIGRQEIIRVNRLDLLGRILYFVLMVCTVGILSVLGRRMTAIVLVWINVVVAILTNLIFLWPLRPLLRASDGRGSGFRYVLAFAFPCYLSNSAQFLNYRLDVFVVNFFVGVEGVGLYTLAVSIAQLIWLISNAAATVLFPRVAAGQESAAAIAAHTAQATRVALGVSMLSAASLALLARPLLPLVYGERFYRSVVPLWYLLPGIVAFSTVNVLASYVAGIGKPQVNLQISLAGLCVTVALDLWLIPRLGIAGAAIASTLSYSISAVLTVWFFRQRSGVRIRDILFVTSQDIRLAVTQMRVILQQKVLRVLRNET